MSPAGTTKTPTTPRRPPMGATNFDTTELGKTADDAFSRARDAAAHEYGHGGYTGTIAEKGSYRLVTPPAGMNGAKLFDLLQKADALNYYVDEAPAKRGSDEARWRREAEKANATLVAKLSAAEVRWLLSVYNDKWGDCLAVEITGKAATDAKARRGGSTRGLRLFRFIGFASC